MNQDIHPAELEWQENTPLSLRYKDYYFSLKNGLEETRYTYLTQNGLPDRWIESQQNNSSHQKPASPFTIVETGFGTGLNFLTTWLSWQQLTLTSTAQKKRPLSFISIEKYPLTKVDLIKSLLNWPELATFSQELIDQYPYLMKGSHLLSFDHGKVKLLLIFGDVNTDLEKHSFIADCWFLDGFSPSKNKSMWTNMLFDLMATRAHNNTTFSSSSAANIVQKGLSKANFKVIKKTGYDGKCDITTGYFDGGISKERFSPETPKWSLTDSVPKRNHSNPIHNETYDVIIIGAGLAGVTTAATLAKQNLKVAIIDKKSQAVSGASGQHQLALYVKLPTEINKVSEFISHCIQFSQRFLASEQGKHPSTSFWHNTGLLQLAWSEQELARQNKMINNCNYPSDFVRKVSSNDATKLSGINTKSEALWFQNSGWLNPGNYSQALLEHESITLFTNTEISHIKHSQKDNTWQAISPTQTLKAKFLIVANSNRAKLFNQLEHLPTKPLRGQVSAISDTSLSTTKTVLCGEGYLCPAIDNWHHFGATFDLNQNNDQTHEIDDQKNIASIQKWLPDWLPQQTSTSKLIQEQRLSSKAGLRCTTPDYMPIIGKVPIYDEMLEAFSDLRRDATSCKNVYGKYYSNLYVNIGHGSKGLVTSSIAAEYISSLITGSPDPFSATQKIVVSPARFIIKRLKQKKI